MLISCAVTTTDLRLGFRICKTLVSHDAAHLPRLLCQDIKIHFLTESFSTGYDFVYPSKVTLAYHNS